MARTTLAAALVAGALLASGCGEANYGRSSEDSPREPRAVPEASLHFKHPVSLTALHRLNITSGNHPDILRAGVRRGLELIKTDAPGITASVSATYESERTIYEFDLASGTVAKEMRVPWPVATPLVIVKPPDQGGDRATYLTIVREMQRLVSRVSGRLWDWLTAGGANPHELRQAASYLQSVIEDVERGAAAR